MDSSPIHVECPIGLPSFLCGLRHMYTIGGAIGVCLVLCQADLTRDTGRTVRTRCLSPAPSMIGGRQCGWTRRATCLRRRFSCPARTRRFITRYVEKDYLQRRLPRAPAVALGLRPREVRKEHSAPLLKTSIRAIRSRSGIQAPELQSDSAQSSHSPCLEQQAAVFLKCIPQLIPRVSAN